MPSETLRELPRMSPTVALIWARPTRSRSVRSAISSIMAAAPERQVQVAVRPDVVLEVPPLVQVGGEAEPLHRALQGEPVPEDAARRVVGVRARPEVVSAHAEPLAVAPPDQGEVDRAPGVVTAPARDVGAHEVALAGAVGPVHERLCRAQGPVGVEDQQAEPAPAQEAVDLADVERGPLVQERPLLAVAGESPAGLVPPRPVREVHADLRRVPVHVLEARAAGGAVPGE